MTSYLRGELINILGGKCVDCGIADLSVLQIHHKFKDGVEDRKRFENKTARFYQYYLDHIDEARFNLEVLCANHHLKRRSFVEIGIDGKPKPQFYIFRPSLKQSVIPGKEAPEFFYFSAREAFEQFKHYEREEGNHASVNYITAGEYKAFLRTLRRSFGGKLNDEEVEEALPCLLRLGVVEEMELGKFRSRKLDELGRVILQARFGD